MDRTLAKLRAKEPVTIVVTGDSCSVDTHWTWGHKNWVQLLAEAVWETYGDGFITVINSSKCGNSYAEELKRLPQSILRFQPDVVVSAIVLGDQGRGREGLEQTKEAARQFVRRIRETCGSEVLLMTFNPVVYGYWSPVPEGTKPGEPFPAPGRGEANADALLELGRELGLPVADVFGEWTRRRIPFRLMTAHPQWLRMRMADTVHPNAQGHLAIFREVAPFFQVPRYFPWEEVPVAFLETEAPLAGT
jgi:lysophospholipase L1-like esterase